MKSLNEDLKTGQFKQIYLLYGEEAYLKKLYKNRFVKAMVPEGDTMNYRYFEGKNTNPKEIIDLAETLPFFAERRLIVLDTLCASVGQAMLVREAARKQQEGLSIDELAAWVEENRLKICHWFTVDSFDHLKHGGRISAAAAAVGTMLQIKPLLHVDDEGKLRVAEKPRGRKQAIRTQIAHMKEGWTPEMSRLVVIGHGDCPEDAEQLRQAVLREFPDADIRTAYIGPIIGAHTGPGMLALIYWGANR